MKRFIITSLVICALTASLMAQPPGGPGGGQRQPPDFSKINNGKPLTEAQTKAIKAASDKRMEAMKKITDAYKADMAKALGISVAELEKRAAAAGLRMGGGRPGGGGGPGGGPGGMMGGRPGGMGAAGKGPGR